MNLSLFSLRCSFLETVHGNNSDIGKFILPEDKYQIDTVLSQRNIHVCDKILKQILWYNNWW